MPAESPHLASWLKPHQTGRPLRTRRLQCEQLEDRLTPVLGGYDILPLTQEPYSLMPGSISDNFAGVVNYAESCTGALVDRGGVVVGSRHIILAAHCQPAVGDLVTFYLPNAPLGVPDGTLKTITIPVTSVWIHPAYDRFTAKNDIAIATLESVAPFGATAYQLNTARDEIGKKFVISGYGATGTGTSGQTLFAGGQNADYELQRMTINATGGRFFVSIPDGNIEDDVGDIPLTATSTAAEIQTAIDQLFIVNSVRVTKIAAGPYAGSFEILWLDPSGNQPELKFVSDTGTNVLVNGFNPGNVDFVTLHNGADTEFQRVIENGTSGTFQLALTLPPVARPAPGVGFFPPETVVTAPINFNATAREVEDAINAVPGFGPVTVYKSAPGNYSVQFDRNGDIAQMVFLAQDTLAGTGSVQTIQNGGARTFRIGENRYDSSPRGTTFLQSDFTSNSTDQFEGQGDSGGAGFIDVGSGRYKIASIVSNGGFRFGQLELNTRVSTFAAVLDTVLNPTVTKYPLVLDMAKQVAGDDKIADTISVSEVDGYLYIVVNGNLYYRDLAANISSLRIRGSSDNDTFLMTGPMTITDVLFTGGGGIDTMPVVGGVGDDRFTFFSSGAASGTIVDNGTVVNYTGIQKISFDGGAGTNSLSWIDTSNQSYGSLAAPLSGIVYVPVSGDAGEVRINNNTSGFSFANINGSFVLNGDRDGSGDRDTLTVLAPSEAGGQSGYFEAAFGTGIDTINVSDQSVSISDSTAGNLRSVAFGSTFSSLYVRGGNETGKIGDTVTVTPSLTMNIIVDGMGPQRSRPGDRLIVNSTGDFTLSPDPFAPGTNRYTRTADGAGFSFLAFEAVPGANIVAVATDAGVDGEVRALDPTTGAVRWVARPFGSFTGGLRLAVGDINGDGIKDVVVAAGPGGGPRIVVLNGADGSELFSFYAFSPLFAGGVNVGTGDVNGDGFVDIIAGADAGGNSHVKVFNGKNVQELRSFYGFSPTYEFGVRVAGGDVNGDGFSEVLVGASFGGRPEYRIYDGASNKLLQSSLAFAAEFTGGIFISAGDVNGDGFADVIIGAGRAGNPHVKVFSGATGGELASFYVNEEFSPDAISSVVYEYGVSVAAADLDGDGIAEILTSKGRGSRSILRSFKLARRDAFGNTIATGLQEFRSTTVFEDYFGGFSVGG